MYSVGELKVILKSKLSDKRYIHSMNVANEAFKLAQKFNADTNDAYIAGLLHDICKEIPKSEQYEMALKSDRGVSEIELMTPPLLHGIAGAYFVENTLSIKDEDILNAIRYHTIGRADMSNLEKIIYLADLISAERTYKDVTKMRKIVYRSLDCGMLCALKFSINDVVKKGSMLPLDTIRAYNQYQMAEIKKS